MKQVDPMARHYCEANQCELAAVACASRYDRVVHRPKESLWSQIHDPHCASCRIGKQMLKTLGKNAVDDYRRGLTAIRNQGKRRLGWSMREDLYG